MNSDIWYMLVVGVFIIVDYGTGVVNAIIKHELSSEKMRDGLAHKFAYVVVMFLGWFIEFAMKHVDIGFAVPLFAPVSVAIALIEITSILENVVKINPEIADNNILDIFERK